MQTVSALISFEASIAVTLVCRHWTHIIAHGPAGFVVHLLLMMLQVLQEAGRLCFQSMRASCSSRVTPQAQQQEAQGYSPHQHASGAGAPAYRRSALPAFC